VKWLVVFGECNLRRLSYRREVGDNERLHRSKRCIVLSHNPWYQLSGQRPNRSLNLTRTRAEFFVRREYSKGSMLVVKQVLGDNTEIVTQTAVQNGARRLAPNR